MGVAATREERLAVLRQILKGKAKQVLVVAELGPWKGHSAFLDGIKAAADAGADIVKVQVFRALHFPPEEWKAKECLEWRRDCLPEFVKVVHIRGMLACASVFDLGAVVACSLADADILKLATREKDNLRLYEQCRDSDLPLFWSKYPAVMDRRLIRTTPNLREIILGCIPQYPTRADVAHSGLIRFENEMLDAAENVWGWSSHTPGWTDCIEAIMIGACIIEKHLALLPDDPEATWSLLPEDFAKMVASIREVENAR